MAYPGVNPFLLSYDELVGLWLDRDRARLARLWEAVQQAAWAASGAPLPPELFDAAAGDPYEAQVLEYETNKRRA